MFFNVFLIEWVQIILLKIWLNSQKSVYFIIFGLNQIFNKVSSMCLSYKAY